MQKHSARQALAIRARHTASGEISSQPALPNVLATPGIPGGGISALESEAARVVAEDVSKRAGNGSAGASGILASGHVVIDGGRLSGLIRDAHTTVRFAGGSIAVTTHE
jgi:hypothetical protein